MGSKKRELLGELEPSWSGVAAPDAGPAVGARERARLRETLDAYAREISASVDPRRRAALSHEVGRIHEDAFGDVRQAIREYQRAFRADPTHLPTLVAVRRLFAKAGKWAMVSRVLDAELRARTRREDRARLLCEKGDLHLLRFNDPEGARQAFEAAVELNGASVRAVAGLARAAALSGRGDVAAEALLELTRWVEAPVAAATVRVQAATELADQRPGEAAQITRSALTEADGVARGWALWGALEPDAGLEAVASAIGAPGARARLLVEAARRRRGQDPERALELAREATALAPVGPFAWDLIAELEQAAGRWAEAADALAEGAAVAGPATDRVDRLWRLADLRLHRLGDIDGATQTLQQLLSLAPGWPPALERVERLLASQGDWEAVAQVRLAHLASVEDDHDRADAWFRMGVLYEEHLGDQARAADAYRAAVEARADFLDASKALGRILLARGDWVGYAELLQEEASRTAGLDQRIRLLTRVAEIAEERLDQPEWALAACRSILTDRPDHGATAARAGRLLAHLGRWGELLEINEHELEEVTSPGHRLALLVRSGEICARELGDAERALEYLERALTLAPRYAPALELATAVMQRLGYWQGLVDLLRRQLAVAHGAAERARLAFRIGEVLRDRLNDADGALAAFEEAREVGGEDVSSLFALAALHHQRGAYDREHEILGSVLERLDSPEDQAEVLFRMGGLCERLGEPGDAADAWERALALTPEHQGAATALLRTFEQQGDPSAVAVLRRRLARASVDPGAAIVHWSAVGRVAAGLPSRRAEAIEAYEALVALAPGDLGALLALERLHLAEGDLERVADVYGRIAETARGLPLRAEYTARRARLRMDALGDPDGAIQDFLAVLQWVPDHAEALARVERHAARVGDVEGLAAVLEQRLATAGSDKERVLILERAGEALWRADRLQDAVRCYDAVVAMDPNSIAALRALRAIYAELGETEASAAMTEAEGQQALDPRNAVELLLQAGSAHESARKDPRAALADYRAALARDPLDDDALAAVRRVCERTGRWEELAEQLEATAEARPGQRIALWQEVAHIYARRLGSMDRALALLARVAEHPEAGPEAWQALADARVEQEDWEGAVEAYRRVVDAAQDSELARAVSLRIAAIHEGKRDDPAAALPWLERALASAPDPHGWLRLARVAEAAGAVAQARHALRQGLEAAGDEQPVADDLREELARLSPDPLDRVALLRAVRAPREPLVAAQRFADAACAAGEPSAMLPVLSRWAADARGAAAKRIRRMLVERALEAGVATSRLLDPIEQLINADPDDEGLRRLHVAALGRGDVAPERRVAAWRWLLARDPCRAADLEGLRRVQERAGAVAAATEIARLRIALGSGVHADRELVEQALPRERRWPLRPLTSVDRRLVWGEGATAAWATTLARLGEGLPELFRAPTPAAVAAHGPVPDRARQVAELLGVEVGPVSIDERPLAQVVLQGRTLHVSQGLSRLPTGEQTFLIGVGVELNARGVGWLQRWSPKALEDVLLALAATADERFAGRVRPERSAALVSRVRARLPGLQADLAQLARLLQTRSVARARADILTSAHRIGMAVGGGVVPAVAALQRLHDERGGAPDQRPAGVEGLARWVVGDPWLALRRRLGLERAAP